MANDKWLEELGDQLREHGSEVNPNLWQGISSQIGVNASGAATGGMSLAKIAAIVGVSVTTVALTYFAFNSPKEEKVNTTSEVQTEGPTTEKETIVVEKPTAETKSIDAKTRSEKAVVTEKETIVKPKEVTTTVLSNDPVLPEIVAPKAPESILSIKEKTQKAAPPTTQSQQVVQEEAKKLIQNDLPPLVNNAKKPQTQAEFISLPNVFTPNGDGVNDEFFVVTTGMENYSLVVLDANSQVVWKTNNPDERWDGKSLNGDKLPIGSYIYFITAQDELGTPVNKHQRLQLQ